MSEQREHGLFIPFGLIAWLWGFLVGGSIAAGIVLCAVGYGDPAGLVCIIAPPLLHLFVALIVVGA